LVGRPFAIDVSDTDPLELRVADGIVYGSGVFRIGMSQSSQRPLRRSETLNARSSDWRPLSRGSHIVS